MVNSQRLKPFWALSRTPHGLIDMSAPALAALLYLGQWPPAVVIFIGIITVFAGYTAVYALNDIVDYRADKKKIQQTTSAEAENYLDNALPRHPMVQGKLSLASGLIWTTGWGLVAVMGAWWLNPVCLYLFLAGCVLEAVYCLLWRVSPLRAVINGIVKTIGPLAAIFAVDPEPDQLFLFLIFLWFFAWEIGGQNIPADWTDVEKDRQLQAKTIPIQLGVERAGKLAAAALTVAMLLAPLVLWISPLRFGLIHWLSAAGFSVYLLLLPGFKLMQNPSAPQAVVLFNKASYYPLAMLIVTLWCMISK